MSSERFISKDDINQLPLYECDGDIVLIASKDDAVGAIQHLKNESVLGFDTETRPAFKKGESYPISLLQLATDTTAYLFQLNKSPMTPELADILADPKITKVGVAIRDDIKGLQKLYPFEPHGFVELADLAKEKQIENKGLRGLTAICLNKRLSKRAKISNWARKELTPEQITYAACDAFAGLQVYQKLRDWTA